PAAGEARAWIAISLHAGVHERQRVRRNIAEDIVEVEVAVALGVARPAALHAGDDGLGNGIGRLVLQGTVLELGAERPSRYTRHDHRSGRIALEHRSGSAERPVVDRAAVQPGMEAGHGLELIV